MFQFTSKTPSNLNPNPPKPYTAVTIESLFRKKITLKYLCSQNELFDLGVSIKVDFFEKIKKCWE